MNTGGRRSPLGSLLSGLACCALLIVVLSLGLGTTSGRSLVNADKVLTISHAVTSTLVDARPAPSDQYAVPVAVVTLAVMPLFVLVSRRRAVPAPLRPVRRASVRAPPGPLVHR